MFRGLLKPTPGNYIEDEKNPYKWQILWPAVVFLSLVHICTFHLLFLLFTFQLTFKRVAFLALFGIFTGLGSTAGAHRLWSHRSYKANLPLRIILMLAHAGGMQNNLYEWVRDHRVHHKFSDTDADPHNPARGFFFAHCGWVMLRKHPEVRRKAKTIDFSDLFADPVVQFQLKYYYTLVFIVGVLTPVALQHYMFGDSLWFSFIIRIGSYGYTLNSSWIVNSVAHLWGMKPYDKNIPPTDNRYISVISLGEGFHNYHHVFPWDYKSSELGNYRINLTTAFIDLMAAIGWATDLKSPTIEMIINRKQRTGEVDENEETNEDCQ